MATPSSLLHSLTHRLRKGISATSLIIASTAFSLTQVATGTVLQLASGAHATVPAASFMNETSGFVVEAWVKPAVAGFNTIASRGEGNDPVSPSHWIMQITPTGQLAFYYNRDWQYSAADVVPVGRWTHVAVEFYVQPGNVPEARKQLWINGQPHGAPVSSLLFPVALSATEALQIGRQGSVCQCNRMNGQLEELRIWRRADWTTRSSRPDTSQNSYPADTPGLLAYYRFNEASGTAIIDSSGAARNGTLSTLTGAERVTGSVPFGAGLMVTGVVGGADNPFNDQDGKTTFNEAVNFAIALGGPQTITFSDNTLNGATNFYDGIYRGSQTSFPFVISTPLTILGPGANRFEVFARFATRHFHFSGTEAKTIRGINFTGGRVSSPEVGGSILQLGGTLTLDQCSFGDNRSPNGRDGCIHVSNGTLILNGCTFQANSAGAGSGALHATSTTSGSTNVSLNQCTFSGNFINDEGSPNPPQDGVGAILATGSNTTINLLHCTLSGNSGSTTTEENPFTGSLEVSGATANLTNTIIANSTGADVRPSGPNSVINFIGKNIIETGTASANVIAGDPKLGDLSNFGGSTNVHILLADSIAINAGISSFGNSLTTDQRGSGFPRIIGSQVDIGAVESPGTSDFAQWRQLQALASDGSQDLQNPSQDGIPNLLKYAFNLAPTFKSINSPNLNILSLNGSAGLPNISRDPSGRLTITFLRRNASRNPGINYIVETGSTLVDFAPLDLSGATTSSVDTFFQRVTVTDPAVSPRRFGRVRVEKVAP